MNKKNLYRLVDSDILMTKGISEKAWKDKRKFKDFCYNPPKCNNCGRDVDPNHFWVKKDGMKEEIYCINCMQMIM